MPAAPPIRLIAPDALTAVLVAFSGGMDSTVLLHLLADDAAMRTRGLRALHVHHGLQADADDWATHCLQVCAGLGIHCEIAQVAVDRESGLGPEASARQARRAAFARHLRPGETLALAQHHDDQAETFLLRALRASGTDGLAAMRAWRAFAAGWMWRPLLDTPRATLMAYAQAQSLHWIEDPSNRETALDRNFLRHQVLPLLRERWPAADAAFARAAGLAAESSALLAEHDAQLLAAVRGDSEASLSVLALQGLSPAQRARVLRRWVADLGWPPLPAEGVARIEADLLGAGLDRDRMPRFAWHGADIRRWRDGLHAVDAGRELPAAWSCLWDGRAPLTLPNGDCLELIGASGFDAPLRVHARRGGERILPAGGDGHHRTLKHLLQERGIPPWERARMPLLSDAGDDVLLAAADRVTSSKFETWLRSHNARLLWTRVDAARENANDEPPPVG